MRERKSGLKKKVEEAEELDVNKIINEMNLRYEKAKVAQSFQQPTFVLQKREPNESLLPENFQKTRELVLKEFVGGIKEEAKKLKIHLA